MNKDKIVRVLLFSLILSLIPIILASSLIPGLEKKFVYQLIVGSVLIIQIILLLKFYLLNDNLKISINLLIISTFYLMNQILTLLLCSINNMNINYLDYINCSTRFICCFIFLCIPSCYKISHLAFLKFMKIIIYLAVIACIYNMVSNFNEIINIVHVRNPYLVNFKSFFLNRNAFAQLLFIAFIANTYLYSKQKSKTTILFLIIIVFNILIALSRTVILSVIIFLICKYIFSFKISFKKVFPIAIVLLVFTIIWNNIVLREFIFSMFIRKEAADSGRMLLWSIAFDILNRTNWIFGIGYMTSIEYIKNLNYNIHEFHSFYVETLVGGGILDLFFYMLIFVMIIQKIKVNLKSDKNTSMILYSSYISLAAYSLTESVSFFSIGYVGTLFTIFFITIPYLFTNNLPTKERIG